MARARIFSVGVGVLSGLSSCFSCERVAESGSVALVLVGSSPEGLGTLSSEAGCADSDSVVSRRALSKRAALASLRSLSADLRFCTLLVSMPGVLVIASACACAKSGSMNLAISRTHFDLDGAA